MVEQYLMEYDISTGHVRQLSNTKHSPWKATFSEEEIAETIKWRQANISGKYRYFIGDEPLGGVK